MLLVRAAIALAVACGVLLAGAWAGGAFAPALAQPAGPRRAGIPEAPPAQRESAEIAVGDALVVNGQPMQLSVSYTADRPFQVAELYAAAFRSRGLLPIGTADARLGHVSVFDPADGLQRSVTALLEPSGLTLVLLAVSDPRRFALVPAREPDAPYPIPDDHRAFLGYRSQDGQANAHSGQFVTRMSAAQVGAFYRRTLLAQGYAERTGDSLASLLIFEKGDSAVSVAVQALQEGSGAVVFVNRREGAP